jgi:virginiamycin B lyase
MRPIGLKAYLPVPGGLWFAALLFGGALASWAQSLAVTEYPLPTPGAEVLRLALGPDGAIWFTEFVSNKIGRITNAGVVTEYPIPTSGSEPVGIAAGPDGAIWFTEYASGKIGRIDATGAIAEYSVPSAGGGLSGITAGPDQALWFTEFTGNAIGRITTAGTITEYPIPTADGSPAAIVSGPDGGLWFTEYSGNKIGRISTSGAVAEYAIPTAASVPVAITAGPDSALWFVEYSANKIGRITTSGAFNEYPVPTANSGPAGIITGSDGALWFPENNSEKMGRITVAGAITEYQLTNSSSSPLDGIATGSDGSLWFSESNLLGRVVLEVPNLALTALPATVTADTQYNLQPSLGAAFPVAVTVNLTLTFTPASGADDPAVQFSSGGRSTTFTIPAGATAAPTAVGIQTGSVAGVLTITAQLLIGAQDITPTPAPSTTSSITLSAPVITSVAVTPSSTGFSVSVIGYSTSRQVTSATFQFNAASGTTIQTGTLTIATTTLFSQYYQSSASAPFGSQFNLVQPFTVQGNTQGVLSVTVTLMNSIGTSTPVTGNVQ